MGFSEIGFCWVREQERTKTQHYHFVLFFDGRKIRHSSKINQLVKYASEDPTAVSTVWHAKRQFYLANTEDVIQK